MLRVKLLTFGHNLIENQRSWVFAPLSWFYALIVWSRNILYDFSILKTKKVEPVVVSVGNVLVGGTGKTPFVLKLASAFSHRRVAILSRGYGSLPDEAILAAKRLPSVRVVIGKDRSTLAQQIKDVDLIILDDGFQHRKLFRDFDIVLTKEGKHHYLPWGFLRDSLKRLKKCDAVFVKEKDFALETQRILDQKGSEIDSIKGWKVNLFSGIADPKSFQKTVSQMGAKIQNSINFFDHEQADLSKLPIDLPLICTEKDFVKLPQNKMPIFYLEMKVKFKDEGQIWEKMIEKIDQKIHNKCTYEREN